MIVRGRYDPIRPQIDSRLQHAPQDENDRRTRHRAFGAGFRAGGFDCFRALGAVVKIENIAVRPRRESNKSLQEFVRLLMKLKTGQSFVMDDASSHHRIVISVLQHEHDGMKFSLCRDGSKWRIGRTA
jgi:hypothetical protein